MSTQCLLGVKNVSSSLYIKTDYISCRDAVASRNSDINSFGSDLESNCG